MHGIAHNKVSVSPAQPLDKAVSGHYAGWINGSLSTYGGCNFPDIPCADGGQKVYYPQAYGASVHVPDGVVFKNVSTHSFALSDAMKKLFINLQYIEFVHISAEYLKQKCQHRQTPLL